MHTNIMRLGVVFILVSVIGSVVIALLTRTTETRNPTVLSEGVTCLSAICISDTKYGNSCLEVRPSVAQVILSQDINEPDANRMTITFNSNLCKR